MGSDCPTVEGASTLGNAAFGEWGAANAIAQIREKNYAAPFALSQKRITLVGLSFPSEKRTVTDSAAEPL